MKIIDNEKKKMIPLTDKENQSYKSNKFVTYIKENLVLINYTTK